MAESYRLIFLNQSAYTSQFTKPRKPGPDPKIPLRNRQDHATMIRRKLDAAWQMMRQRAEQRTAVAMPARQGVYLEFESARMETWSPKVSKTDALASGC